MESVLWVFSPRLLPYPRLCPYDMIEEKPIWKQKEYR